MTIPDNFANATGETQNGYQGDVYSFSDSATVSDWAFTSMQWAISNGIVTGTDDHRINPTGTATRAEIAAILTRFINLTN